MKVCRQVQEVRRGDGYWSILTNCVEIRLWFVTEDILRIRAGFDGDFAEESYSLVLTAWEDRMDGVLGDERRRVSPRDAVLKDGEERAVIDSGTLRVVVDKHPMRLRVYDRDGSLLHADCVDLAYQEDANHRRIHTSQISPDDLFFGFGEKAGEWNKAQSFLTMNPRDAMGYDPAKTDSLYKHIPFYIRLNRRTTRAVGYFYHNTAECDFDMGRSKSNYWPMHSRYRTDSGDVDLFLIAGPSIREVVSRYTDLTGKSAMLPRGALGYLGSSMYYAELPENCDEAIETFIQTVADEGIPCDGFQLSSGYTTQDTPAGAKRCVFTWNRRRFRDPKGFFTGLRERGILVSPNVKPGILLAHPRVQEWAGQGLFVRDSETDEPGVGTWWGGEGVFADFTRPQTREIWKRLLRENVLEMGTASVWNDNCEYDSMVDKDCRCDFEGKGTTIGAVKAVMSNLMCRVTKEAIAEAWPDERPFIVCRSGHSGIQRYAQTWAGDNLTGWPTLKYNIATMLGMSLSGVANQGNDIGGFYGPAPDAELLVRWVQNGIFQPRFSIHSTNTDNTVTEPWMYRESTPYIRDAIRFRYRLSPYYYSLMERAHRTGLPIVEPMCSAFQHDPRCYDEAVDFMAGDALLVANVVEQGAKERSVYLPAGEVFYDFHTRERYEGGQTVTLPVTLGSFPLFVREGGIVPMASNQLMNLTKDHVEEYHLLCAPGRDGSFELYEDDGHSMAYERGEYLRTRIEMRCGQKTVLRFTREGAYRSTAKTLLIDMIHPEKAPFYVLVDGREIPHFLYDRRFDEAGEGWYYDQTKKSVQIRLPMPEGNFEVLTSFEVFDLIGM